MDKLVREQIRAWKAGMEEMNLMILQEKRARTPAESFLLMQVGLCRRVSYGRSTGGQNADPPKQGTAPAIVSLQSRRIGDIAPLMPM